MLCLKYLVGLEELILDGLILQVLIVADWLGVERLAWIGHSDCRVGEDEGGVVMIATQCMVFQLETKILIVDIGQINKMRVSQCPSWDGLH